MKRTTALMIVLLLLGGLFTTTSGQVSAEDSCVAVDRLTINGSPDVSFTFYNDRGRYEAVAAANGGWWVGDYRTGRLSFANTIRYYNGDGNTEDARNNGDGTFSIRDGNGNVVRTGYLTVDDAGSTNMIVSDANMELAIQLMEWWQARRQGKQSWATCHV